MRAVVIYESLTGKTERASFVLADELIRLGIPTVAYDVDGTIDLDTLAAADVVVVGTWVSGHFIINQKPGGAGKLARNHSTMLNVRMMPPTRRMKISARCHSPSARLRAEGQW